MEPSEESMEKFQHKDGYISYLKTPWDAKVLGYESISIEEINSPSLRYKSLLSDFLQYCKKLDIGFISTRIPASINLLRSELQSYGFRVVEHTLDVQSSSIDHNLIQNLVQRIPLQTTENILDHIKDTKNIASEAFRFGRFHEDPIINNDTANLRNRNWIDDLIRQESHFNILLKKETAVGFMSWKKDSDDHVKLLFGGVLEKYQHLAYSFWADSIQKTQPFTSITTTISSSNTPIANLYRYYGFNFTNPQFGLTWHSK